MIITHGRLARFLEAGNTIACRYCVHYGAKPAPAGERPGFTYCPEKAWYVLPAGNCNLFEREPGTDD